MKKLVMGGDGIGPEVIEGTVAAVPAEGKVRTPDTGAARARRMWPAR